MAETRKLIEQQKPFHYETREVLAAAYLGPNKGRPHQRMLSHLVEVGSLGSTVRVMCGKVSPLSMAGRAAADPSARPTCERCASKFDKLSETSA